MERERESEREKNHTRSMLSGWYPMKQRVAIPGDATYRVLWLLTYILSKEGLNKDCWIAQLVEQSIVVFLKLLDQVPVRYP